MDDNARPLAVEELLEGEDITRMDWPAYSPGLNPIEHLWDALGRRIAARLHHPENTQQLKQMLIEESTLIPQELLHQLVLRNVEHRPIPSGHEHEPEYPGETRPGYQPRPQGYPEVIPPQRPRKIKVTGE
ncbi:transposable element Tc3 transposase [Trichonephila clavipes]|uniref:Transposable element Tc3 transposase n=1 Tax=Trichonephila clavipes TaxID=2585209 RepID=A0A8X6SHA8_TRICX|nr:transposable element Tc3 transposase [Trichonephila clavipes]